MDSTTLIMIAIITVVSIILIVTNFHLHGLVKATFLSSRKEDKDIKELKDELEKIKTRLEKLENETNK